MIDPRAVQPAPPPLARAVLVDQRDDRRGVTRALLERSGFILVAGEADSRAAAIEIVGQSGADLVIEEIQMPVEEGLATVDALRQRFPLVRIVVCSFHQHATTRRQAMENGADAYIGKPIDLGGLRTLLQQLAARNGTLSATVDASR